MSEALGAFYDEVTTQKLDWVVDSSSIDLSLPQDVDALKDIHSMLDSEIILPPSSSSYMSLVEEEIAEFKQWYNVLKGEVHWDTSFALQDLKAELQWDISALGILQDYSEYQWYEEFMSLLASEGISDAEEEQLYQTINDDKSGFNRYIKFELWGELFPDVESIQSYLTEYGSMRDELADIYTLDISTLSDNDIAYIIRKTQRIWMDPVLSQNINRSDFTDFQESLIKEQSKRAADAESAEDINIEIHNEDWKKVVDKSKHLLELWSLFPDEILSHITSLSEAQNIQEYDSRFKDLIAVLSENPTLMKDSLVQAQKSENPDVLLQTRDFFRGIAASSPELSNTLAKIEIDLGLKNMGGGEVRDAQIRAYFSSSDVNMDELEVNGDVFTLGDLQVDAGTQPPRAFVVDESGKLRVGVGMPEYPNDAETLNLRREFAKRKLEINENYANTFGELKQQKLEQARFEELESKKPLTQEEAKELSELKSSEEERLAKIDELTWKIVEIKKEAAALSKEYEDKFQAVNFELKEREKEQENARFAIKLMRYLGVPVIGQSSLEQIIYEIQSRGINLDLGGSNGFSAQNIDLKSLKFGQNNIMDEEGNTRQFVEYFMRFINLMCFGDPAWWIREDGSIKGFKLSSATQITTIDDIPEPSTFVSEMYNSAGMYSAELWFNFEKARNNLWYGTQKTEKDPTDWINELLWEK